MPKSKYLLTSAAIMLGGSLASAVSLRLSRSAFTGYDVSPMIDSGWRVFSGQVPATDFIVTFPPSLYLAVAASYRLFGVTWHAIALGEVVLYLAIMLLGLRVGALIQAGWGLRAALAIAAVFSAGQTLLLVSINYPWHASMAESFGLYAVLATLALVSPGPSSSVLRVEAVGHLALATALLLLSKPNTSYLILLVCLVVLSRRGIRWQISLSIAIFSLAADSILLAAAHTNLWAMLHGYLGLTGRLRPRGFLIGITWPQIPHYALVNLLVYAVLAPLLTTLVAMLWRSHKSIPQHPAHLLAVGSILTAFAGMGTNFDFKLTDTPLLLLGIALLTECPRTPSPSALRFRLATTTLALIAVAAYLGRSRYRMLWHEPECPDQIRITTSQDPFLGPMRVCSSLADTLTQTDQILRQHPTDHIFFGPSLEFLYAGRALASPLHLPNWWDPGTSFPLDAAPRIAAAWQQDQFDLLIFMNDEYRGAMPPSISPLIERDYIRVPGTSAIHVYRKR